MSQLNTIREILEREGKIDNWSAIDTRLTTRLAMHIHKLRQEGWVITSKENGRNCTYTLLSRPPTAPQTLF